MTNEKTTRHLYAKTCTECGAEFTTPVKTCEFCDKGCRMAWHNRRRDRGAELYDILMTCRFDREHAENEGLVLSTILSNLAGHYRDADKDKRAGRKSWDKNAHLRLPLGYFGGDGR